MRKKTSGFMSGLSRPGLWACTALAGALMFSGCQKAALPPAAPAKPSLLMPKWSKPLPLYSGLKPFDSVNAALDMDGGLHVALESEGKVELLHVELPTGEEAKAEDAKVFRQEFTGKNPSLVFTNNPADIGDYRLFLAVVEGGELVVRVLRFPPFDASDDQKGKYPVEATHHLGPVAAYSLHGGLSQEGHIAALAATDGKTVSLFNLSPKGVEKGPVLSASAPVKDVFVSQDAETGVHLAYNAGEGEKQQAFYQSFAKGWVSKEKVLGIAEYPIQSFLFSQSSQVHFGSVRDDEKLAYFSMLNDWLDAEIRGLSLGIDEMALERTLNYEGAGDACAAKVRTDNSPFFGHLMWLDGCGGKEQGLGYAKVDLKEERFIVGQSYLARGPGLVYDFAFDGDNYLNLFYVTVSKGHYMLFHQTYANQDRLPKQKDAKDEEES